LFTLFLIEEPFLLFSSSTYSPSSSFTSSSSLFHSHTLIVSHLDGSSSHLIQYQSKLTTPAPFIHSLLVSPVSRLSLPHLISTWMLPRGARFL
jgi:hypothetical protein